MDMTLIPVILSGGAGTRLWPLSREMYPKQLLALTGRQTMLQDTAARLAGIAGGARSDRRVQRGAPLHGGRAAARPRICARAPSCSSRSAATPPRRSRWPRSQALTDGSRGDAGGGARRSRGARRPTRSSRPRSRRPRLAADGKLVTFGIVAHAPETGYGYIRRGEGAGPAYPVAQFIEKPRSGCGAVSSSRRGDYYWNSGMFVFKASRYLAELQNFAPDILEASKAAFEAAKTDLDFVRIDKALVRALPQRLDRLRGDGEDPRRGGAAARCGLERCRLLGLAVRCVAGRRGRQRAARATCWCTTRTIATCIRPAAWWPPSGWTITSSSRPRTRCWSRPRSACRTSRSWWPS